MRFSVQYIPLSKIKPELSSQLSQRVKNLRNRMWDCMHVMVVRKRKKDGTYMVLVGRDRYEYLRNHSKKKYAPCIVDESKIAAGLKEWASQLPSLTTLRRSVKYGAKPSGWVIIRSFLRQEPRFHDLPRSKQIQVLMMAVRYRKTVVMSMRAAVHKMLEENGKRSFRD